MKTKSNKQSEKISAISRIYKCPPITFTNVLIKISQSDSVQFNFVLKNPD